METQQVLTWLQSIVGPVAHDCDYESVSEDASRPCKRIKTRATDDQKTHVPTPPKSLLSPSASSVGPEQAVDMSSPSKRRLNDDWTPRPTRSVMTDDAYSLASSSSYSRTSSPGGNYSGRASPTKQIFSASLQKTGFRQGRFDSDDLPASLMHLRHRLSMIYHGFPILPTRLQIDLAFLHLPQCFFRDDSQTASWKYPSKGLLGSLRSQAIECDVEGKGEAHWNLRVHGRILDWLLEESNDSLHQVAFRSEYCTTARLLSDFRPKEAPSKMIDFCISIRPSNPDDRQQIDLACARRPGHSINHTDCGALSRDAIAISIETKRHGEQYHEALLQIATWHSAQWRSLQWGRRANGDAAAPTNLNLDFLSGLIVQGHDWGFVASTLGEDGMSRVVSPPVQLGDTRTELGILKLMVSLQVLLEDAETRFWPAFRADVLTATRMDV